MAGLKSQTALAVVSLRELILRGEFQPGERIVEVAMANRLGVSRTPVRLALERLAQQGMLENLQTGGFRVRTYTVTEIWDAIELRAAIEGTAARLASNRSSNSVGLEKFRLIASQIEALVQDRHRKELFDFVEAYADLNVTFHVTLLEISKSSILRKTWDQLQSIPFAAPSSTILPEAMEAVLDLALEQHRELVECIAQKQELRAESIAREHARLALKNFEFALRTAGPAASLVTMDWVPNDTVKQ